MWNVDGGLGDPRAAGWFIQVMHSGRGIMIGEMEAGGFNQVQRTLEVQCTFGDQRRRRFHSSLSWSWLGF